MNALRTLKTNISNIYDEKTTLKSKMRYLNAPLCEKTLWKISKKLMRRKPTEKNKLLSPYMDRNRLNTTAKWQELCHLAANGPQETGLHGSLYPQ